VAHAGTDRERTDIRTPDRCIDAASSNQCLYNKQQITSGRSYIDGRRRARRARLYIRCRVRRGTAVVGAPTSILRQDARAQRRRSELATLLAGGWRHATWPLLCRIVCSGYRRDRVVCSWPFCLLVTIVSDMWTEGDATPPARLPAPSILGFIFHCAFITTFDCGRGGGGGGVERRWEGGRPCRRRVAGSPVGR